MAHCCHVGLPAQCSVRYLSIPINYTANLTRPTNATQQARSHSSELEGSAESHIQRLLCPKMRTLASYYRLQRLPDCSGVTATLSRMRHLASPVKRSCIRKPGLKSLLAGKSCNCNSRALHSYTLSLVTPIFNYSIAKWKSSQGETWETPRTHLPEPSSRTVMGYKRQSLDSHDPHPMQSYFEGCF